MSGFLRHTQCMHTRSPTLPFVVFALLLSACSSASPGSGQTSSSVASAAAVTSQPRSSATSSTKTVTSTPSSPKGDVELSNVGPLAVPFSPQAPTANWDAQHEETCEEMSLIMVQRFLTGGSLNATSAEAELQSLVSWMDGEGYGWDVTVAELGSVARGKYGLTPRVIDNPTVESIVRELKAGNPVIVPAAGRDLGNPYFSGEGPWYHMLVITGYRQGTFWEYFITNDPGTRRGEKYEYRADVLLDAIHDWTGVKEEIRTGAKRVLVVEQ